MINAKKNILSLLRGMKGPLSATLKKRQKKNGKNCQNTAAERKSISSGQPAEMADKDAEILAAIDKIEFDFGRDRFTTAQAELLFVYEIGFDIKLGHDCLYAIALSENCGTVIFYIPNDLMERITERAAELHCAPGKYLADIVELRWKARAITEAVSNFVMGPEEAACAFKAELQAANNITHIATTRSNNWLKMHGFPMRRKGKGRKRHE